MLLSHDFFEDVDGLFPLLVIKLEMNRKIFANDKQLFYE